MRGCGIGTACGKHIRTLANAHKRCIERGRERGREIPRQRMRNAEGKAMKGKEMLGKCT